MDQEKPQWFIDYEDRMDVRLSDMERKLDPVADAYRMAGTLGKLVKTTGAAVIMTGTIYFMWISIKTHMNLTLL